MRSATLLQPEDIRWKTYLSKVQHDFYHRPEYLSITAAHEGGSPAAFLARDGENFLLIPLILPGLPEDLNAPHSRDALSPYGYPSPLLHTVGHDPAVVRRLLSLFAEYCRDNGIISFFSRLHPLLHLPLDSFREFGEIFSHGETVYLDLRNSEESLFQDLRRDHRSDIRKARREGFTSAVRGVEHVDEFTTLYHQTMERLQASKFYFFSKEIFRRLLREMSPFFKLMTIYSPDGEPAASCLAGAARPIAQAHLTGNNQKFSKFSPSKLAFFDAALWAKSQGFSALHLGGGLGAQEDSLFRYKAGFSDARAKFHSWRVVFRPDEYSQLVKRRFGAAADLSGHKSFFPLYRAAHQNTSRAN